MEILDVADVHSELLTLREQYNSVFEFSPSGFFLLNQAGLISKVNKAGSDLLGIDKDSLLNKSFSRYIAPDYQRTYTLYRKALLKKKDQQTVELKLLQRSKPLFYAEVRGMSFSNPMTHQVELLLTVVKISTRKQADESDQAEPHESHHAVVTDLNQPLAIIGNYIYGCIHLLESGKYKIPNLIQAMKQAEHELHRTADIIMRLKNFSCKDRVKYDLICIHSVIEDVLTLMQSEMGDNPIPIQYRPIKGLPKIPCDKMDMKQVILNLTRNAIEAMRDMNTPDAKLIIEINRPSTELIEISLIDNGPGFKLETAHQLFDPHFTTKPYGIGLGLAVSRMIVESHGGKLSVALNPTRGACFMITLPVLS